MTNEQERLADNFIEYEKLRGLKSVRRIKYYMKKFFEYLDEANLNIESVKHKDCQDYQTYLTTLTDKKGEIHYAIKTVIDMIGVLKNFYSYLKYLKVVYHNPFKSVKLLKLEKRLPRDIPDEKSMNDFLGDLKYFWNAKGLRDKRYLYKVHVMSELMYSTGLRLSEVANLEKKDIDFDRSIIEVKGGKGGKDRIVYLNEYAGRVLKIFLEKMKDIVNIRKKHVKVFGCENGRMLDGFLNRHLKKHGEKHNIANFTSHKFRHILGFHLLRSGCDLRYIQIILGHEALNTTTVYTKVNKEDLRSELDKYHPRQFRKSGKKTNDKK